MALSVRMDPLLEKELESTSRRRGITKSQFIIEAVELALGRKDAYQLLLKVRGNVAADSPNARNVQGAQDAQDAEQHATPQPVSTRDRVQEKLRSRHAEDTADWLAARAEPKKPDVPAAAAAAAAALAPRRTRRK